MGCAHGTAVDGIAAFLDLISSRYEVGSCDARYSCIAIIQQRQCSFTDEE